MHALRKWLLSGLLGNVGVKSDEDESYLGTRGIRFFRVSSDLVPFATREDFPVALEFKTVHAKHLAVLKA